MVGWFQQKIIILTQNKKPKLHLTNNFFTAEKIFAKMVQFVRIEEEEIETKS